jgi:hypothetical protein
MKKLSVVFFTIVLLVSLCACSNNRDTEFTNSDTTERKETSNEISVDENLLTVDITVPASFFEDMTEEEIESNSKEQGFTKVVINDDGSVTYTMTKAKRQEILNDYKNELNNTIDSYINGENKVASFKSIRYNNDISKIDIRVDSSLYSAWDSMHTLVFYMYGAYYQIFNGVNKDDIEVIVNFIDDSTNEILDSGSFRKWLENTSSGDDETEYEELTNTGDVPFIKVGETVSIANSCDFKVDYTNIADKILPPSPGSWYSYYTAENGKTYVDVCVSYKNLDTRDIMADEAMSAILLFASKYKYSGFSIIEEDNRKDFTYSNITSISPLTKEYLH